MAVTEAGAPDTSRTRLVVSPAGVASATFWISSGFTSAIDAVPFSIVALTVVEAVLSPEPSILPVKVSPWCGCIVCYCIVILSSFINRTI